MTKGDTPYDIYPSNSAPYVGFSKQSGIFHTEYDKTTKNHVRYMTYRIEGDFPNDLYDAQ